LTTNKQFAAFKENSPREKGEKERDKIETKKNNFYFLTSAIKRIERKKDGEKEKDE